MDAAIIAITAASGSPPRRSMAAPAATRAAMTTALDTASSPPATPSSIPTSVAAGTKNDATLVAAADPSATASPSARSGP